MTTASSLPARPESTAYMIAVTSRIFALDLGGLRRSLVREFGGGKLHPECGCPIHFGLKPA
jgi:hypothetical protein